MFKDYSLFLVFAGFKVVFCEELNLPQVVIPDRKLFFPQNPPKLPRVYLTEKKFALPQCCRVDSEWDDVNLSLKIVADVTEPEPERSAFASLINLIKFILIKEELSCVNAMSGPIVQVQRPEGKIFNGNPSVILNKIESALANKPKQKAKPIEFYDSIDITNMIPIWRPRSNNRRRNQVNVAADEPKTNSTCKSGPKVLQNLGPGLTIVGSNLNPITKELTTKSNCKSPTLTLLKPSPVSNCPRCQNLPSTNVKPVILGCGGCNCNTYQKLPKTILSGCPKLVNAAVLAGCPKTNMVLGGCPTCPYSNPILGCPTCSADILTGNSCQANQAMTVLQSETVPLMDFYGNLMKKVTTTVLVPYSA